MEEIKSLVFNNLHTIYIWFIKLVFVIVLYLILRFLVKFLFKKLLIKVNHLNNVDRSAVNFIISTITFFSNFIIILCLLPILGVTITTIIALLGAIGVGIGIGLQDMAKDIFAGVKLLLIRPIEIDDYIKIEDIEGKVIVINIFYTVLSVNGYSSYIPNRKIADSEIINQSQRVN